MEVLQRLQDFLHLVLGETDLHRAGGRILDLHLLLYILIQLADDIGPQQGIQFLGGIGEKGIIEMDNRRAGTVVPVQPGDACLVEFLLKAASQQVPVAPPPAVDTLFHIAHHQRIVSGGQAVLQQGTEIVPLDIGRILEFVQKEMVEPDAQFLVDKGGVRAVDNAFQDGVAVVQGQQVLLFLDGREGFPQFPRHAQAVQLTGNGEGGIVSLERLSETIQKVLERLVQGTGELPEQMGFAFGEPLLLIGRLGQECLRGANDALPRVRVFI